jgi:hypothetical protein
MFILWIRKRQTDETCPPKDSRESQPKHNEDMKRFRLEHPEIIEVIKARDIVTTDGDILAAVQNVKLAKSSQN